MSDSLLRKFPVFWRFSILSIFISDAIKASTDLVVRLHSKYNPRYNVNQK